MSQFLPGIILIQIVTCGLVFTAFNWSHDFQLIIVITVIAIISAVLLAFWFSSIARNMFTDVQVQLQERYSLDREKILMEAERHKTEVIKEKSQLQGEHARERERILLDAEREKADVIADSYRQIDKETKKIHAKANFKVGVAFAAAAGAGGIMIFSQLVTVGMMLLVASGSGLSGYILRARHDYLSRKKQIAKSGAKMLTNQSDRSLLPKRLSKDK